MVRDPRGALEGTSAPGPASPTTPPPGKTARKRRGLAVGIAAVLLAWVAFNLLFGAAEKESVDHPPNQGELVVGTGLLLPAAACTALAFRAPGSPRVLAWVAVGLLVLGTFWAVGLWMDPLR